MKRETVKSLTILLLTVLCWGNTAHHAGPFRGNTSVDHKTEGQGEL